MSLVPPPHPQPRLLITGAGLLGATPLGRRTFDMSALGLGKLIPETYATDELQISCSALNFELISDCVNQVQTGKRLPATA